MIILKRIVVIFCIYFLILLQNSFFIHFGLMRWVSLPVIFIVLLVIFEKNKSFFSFGFFASVFTGFLLDIYSDNFFGFYIIISILFFIFLKIFVKNYVRIPIFERA